MARGKSPTYGHKEPDPIPGKRFVEVGDGHFAVIDEEDWILVEPYRWRLNSKGIPSTQCRQTDKSYIGIQLKMIILGKRAPKSYAIKNLDGNTLNCSKSNIKMMTLKEARALDREILGPQIRAPKVIKNRLPKPAALPEKKKTSILED